MVTFHDVYCNKMATVECTCTYMPYRPTPAYPGTGTHLHVQGAA